jgi:serine/threonine-protein kinase
LIAAGGMSRVYTAVQKSSQQAVALKVLSKPLTRQPISVQRFIREARIAGELALPHIVSAQGLGRFPDGGYFMALRLIDGPDLTRLSVEPPLPEDRALDLVRRIALVVTQLHDAGWLHCDLKPSNVLLDSHGEPWLTDFAMAQPLLSGNNRPHDTDRFALGGTPAFMAPEQRHGDASLLSPATDIYGLGGILTYLLNGQPPTRSPENLPRRAESATVRILLRCLAEDRAERFASCREFIAALSAAPMTTGSAAR